MNQPRKHIEREKKFFASFIISVLIGISEIFLTFELFWDWAQESLVGVVFFVTGGISGVALFLACLSLASYMFTGRFDTYNRLAETWGKSED